MHKSYQASDWLNMALAWLNFGVSLEQYKLILHVSNKLSFSNECV